MKDKKIKLNILTALLFKVVILLLTIFTKRLLIKYCGNDTNGINTLFINIIGFLSVADLGLSSAIIYEMYNPIQNGDKTKVAALYNLYKKIYRIILTVIGLLGICAIPFLPIIMKGYEANFNINICFVIMLISVLLSYMSSCHQSLIIAHRNDFISTIIISSSTILQNILQIMVLCIFKSYYLYLFARVVTYFFQYLVFEMLIKKKYSDYLIKSTSLDENTINSIKKNVYGMFIHKIGASLVNTTDSIIISAFLGVYVLGLYSNYIVFIVNVINILTLIFTSLISTIGHLNQKEDASNMEKYLLKCHFLNFVLGLIFVSGFFAISTDLVSLCYGTGLELEENVVFVISINYFIQFLRRACLSFREATGCYYHDRYRSLFEGGINVILSIIFVMWFGITGVLVSTIITNLFISHIFEPLMLYKHIFHKSPKYYYLNNITYFLIFIVCMLINNSIYLNIYIDNVIMSILIKGSISVLISLIIIGGIILIKRKVKRNENIISM